MCEFYTDISKHLKNHTMPSVHIMPTGINRIAVRNGEVTQSAQINVSVRGQDGSFTRFTTYKTLKENQLWKDHGMCIKIGDKVNLQCGTKAEVVNITYPDFPDESARVLVQYVKNGETKYQSINENNLVVAS